jgi:hypothetical protein
VSDYFALAADRTRPVAPLRVVRPLARESVLDEIDDPFAAVAPLDDQGSEPARPAAASRVAPPREASDDVGRLDARPADPSTAMPGHEPMEPPSSAPTPGPAEPVPAAPPSPPPHDVAEPPVDRTRVEPPPPSPFVATPPPAQQPETAFDADHEGSGRDADLPSSRDAPHTEAEPGVLTPPEPTAADGALDALAVADAFMRDVIEPSSERVEPQPLDHVVIAAGEPQVVIDRVTLEVVAPERPVGPAPARGRLPRAAGRLASGRRADMRWGS